jgi:hypothetical protein
MVEGRFQRFRPSVYRLEQQFHPIKLFAIRHSSPEVDAAVTGRIPIRVRVRSRNLWTRQLRGGRQGRMAPEPPSRVYRPRRRNSFNRTDFHPESVVTRQRIRSIMWSYSQTSLLLLVVLATTTPHVRAFQALESSIVRRGISSSTLPVTASPPQTLLHATSNSNPQFAAGPDGKTFVHVADPTSIDNRGSPAGQLFQTRNAPPRAATMSSRDARWGRVDVDTGRPLFAMSVAAGASPGDLASGVSSRNSGQQGSTANLAQEWSQMNKGSEGASSSQSNVRGVSPPGQSSMYGNYAQDMSQVNTFGGNVNDSGVSPAGQLFKMGKAKTAASLGSGRDSRWGRVEVDTARPMFAMSAAAGASPNDLASGVTASYRGVRGSSPASAADGNLAQEWSKMSGNQDGDGSPAGRIFKNRNSRTLAPAPETRDSRWGRLDVDTARPLLSMSVAAGATPSDLVVRRPSRADGYSQASNLGSPSARNANTDKMLAESSYSRDSRWGRIDVDTGRPMFAMSAAAGASPNDLPSGVSPRGRGGSLAPYQSNEGQNSGGSPAGRLFQTGNANTAAPRGGSRDSRWGRVEVDTARPMFAMSAAAGASPNDLASGVSATFRGDQGSTFNGNRNQQGPSSSTARTSTAYGNLAEEWSQINKGGD